MIICMLSVIIAIQVVTIFIINDRLSAIEGKIGTIKCWISRKMTQKERSLTHDL